MLNCHFHLTINVRSCRVRFNDDRARVHCSFHIIYPSLRSRSECRRSYYPRSFFFHFNQRRRVCAYCAAAPAHHYSCTQQAAIFVYPFARLLQCEWRVAFFLLFCSSFFNSVLTLDSENCVSKLYGKVKMQLFSVFLCHNRNDVDVWISLSASHMHSLSIGPFDLCGFNETGGVCPFPTADHSAHGKTHQCPSNRKRRRIEKKNEWNEEKKRKTK